MGKKKNEENLKGTLVSVFLVGFIILIMWFGAYGLYLSR
ncbi:cytochrome c oxidase subunit 2A [Aquibacillus sediminis]|nr:cytochrome c oxidase subunit 2A [Aquibacillus sediminis]